MPDVISYRNQNALLYDNRSKRPNTAIAEIRLGCPAGNRGAVILLPSGGI